MAVEIKPPKAPMAATVRGFKAGPRISNLADIWLFAKKPARRRKGGLDWEICAVCRSRVTKLESGK